MAAGLPCILTKVGGCPEIIEDGYNGYLVEPKDYKAIANKIAHLYKNPDLAVKMGDNARKTVLKRFDLASCTKNYQKTFQAVTKSL
jgi:glycosyltransferase involved in cell wall biosynthesis